MHDNLRPQLAEIMDEVEGEAVVVVDQDNHPPGQRFSAVLRGGGEGVKLGTMKPRASEPVWSHNVARPAIAIMPPAIRHVFGFDTRPEGYFVQGVKKTAMRDEQ